MSSGYLVGAAFQATRVRNVSGVARPLATRAEPATFQRARERRDVAARGIWKQAELKPGNFAQKRIRSGGDSGHAKLIRAGECGGDHIVAQRDVAREYARHAAAAYGVSLVRQLGQ